MPWKHIAYGVAPDGQIRTLTDKEYNQVDIVDRSRKYRRDREMQNGADVLMVELEDEIIRLRERVTIRDEEIERLRAHLETE